MIPQKTRHNVKASRYVIDADGERLLMMDEIHFICHCGYVKAFPLAIDGKRMNDGHVESQGDVHADHFYNGMLI